MLIFALLLTACVMPDQPEEPRTYTTTYDAVVASCVAMCECAPNVSACIDGCVARTCETPCTGKQCITAGCDMEPSGTDEQIDACLADMAGTCASYMPEGCPDFILP